MRTQDEVNKQLSELAKEQSELLKLAAGKNTQVLVFNGRYQEWYSRATKLVELLGPEHLEEFVGYYRADPKRKVLSVESYVIQDFIKGLGPARDRFGKIPHDTNNIMARPLVTNFTFSLRYGAGSIPSSPI